MLKKMVTALAAVMVMAGVAYAERFVMVTHTQGTDPFWPVVQKGGQEEAKWSTKGARRREKETTWSQMEAKRATKAILELHFGSILDNFFIKDLYKIEYVFRLRFLIDF